MGLSCFRAISGWDGYGWDRNLCLGLCGANKAKTFGFQKQRKSVSIRAATAIITVDIYLENYDNSSACRIVILTANIYGENYDALEL